MLKFEDQQEGEARLRLFWNCAMRLKEVTDELPEVRDFPMKLKLNGLPLNPDSLDKLEQADGVELSMTFPMLPERQFEVLALRFRPFFADGERVNFLSLLNLLTRHNFGLREWAAEQRSRWGHAVFWGAMGMQGGDIKVDADRVIATGLYSKYFHVDPLRIQEADQHRTAIGSEMFDLALVSAVWGRSLLVVGAASAMKDVLVQTGVVSENEADRQPHDWPSEVKLVLAGGPESLSFGPPGFPKRGGGAP